MPGIELPAVHQPHAKAVCDMLNFLINPNVAETGADERFKNYPVNDRFEAAIYLYIVADSPVMHDLNRIATHDDGRIMELLSPIVGWPQNPYASSTDPVMQEVVAAIRAYDEAHWKSEAQRTSDSDDGE